MAQTSWPFENIDTTEVQFSQWARHINEGIRPDFANELEVFADDSGLSVKVRSGQAMVRGHYYASTAEETLTITTPDATNPRIDSVVLELDIVANSILLTVVAGTPDASPVAPTLTQSEDGNVYQFLLANVDVAAGVFSIEAGDVTDLRTYMFQGVGKWNTATRPENPLEYQTIGYNTDLNTHEVWNGSAWTSVFAPITTEGDLAIGDNTGTAVRLPIGAADTVLTSDGTTATWEEAAGGGADVYATGTHTVNYPAGYFRFETTDSDARLNGATPFFDQMVFHEQITEVSVSGINPTTQNVLELSENLNDVKYFSGPGKYVVTGVNGAFYHSDDAQTWTQSNVPTTDSLVSVVYAGDRYVTGGQRTAYVSFDLVNWTSHTLGFPSSTVGLADLAFGGGTIVALGSGASEALSSPDGITWTSTSTGLGGASYKVDYFANSGLFIASSNGDVSSSSDGTTWSKFDIGITGVGGVAFGNGIYLLAGYYNKIGISTNGTSWTVISTQTGNLYDIAFSSANNYFFMGRDGRFFLTQDGTNIIELDLDITNDIRDVEFDGTDIYLTRSTFVTKLDTTKSALAVTQFAEPVQP